VDHQIWTTEDVAHGLQNFIICIEMVFFAVVHHYVFLYEELNNFMGGLDTVPTFMTESPRALIALKHAENPTKAASEMESGDNENPPMATESISQKRPNTRTIRKREFFMESINFFDITNEISVLLKLRRLSAKSDALEHTLEDSLVS